MNKLLQKTVLLCAAILCLTAHGGAVRAESENPRAVGVVLVNDAQTLPNAKRIDGTILGGQVRFNLDAACAYYIEKDAESGYAGHQSFSRLSFWADCDTNRIGAEGVVSFQIKKDSPNTLSAYYLYADEKGPYFDPVAPFASVKAGGDGPVTGQDFACTIEVEAAEPARRFVLACRSAQGEMLAETEYAEETVEDDQAFPLPKGTSRVEMTVLSADGGVIQSAIFTPEDRNPYICFAQGGQILGSKALHLVWEE